MKRFMQILCIAVGLMLVAFLSINKQNIDAKTDKKSRAERLTFRPFRML